MSGHKEVQEFYGWKIFRRENGTHFAELGPSESVISRQVEVVEGCVRLYRSRDNAQVTCRLSLIERLVELDDEGEAALELLTNAAAILDLSDDDRATIADIAERATGMKVRI